ncbi:MAG: metal-dependent hydrolase [Thermoprotei archaeon]|nr:metal-dependent hydrolase [Thermoprotei archaeon]
MPKITWLGHACFLIEDEIRIIIDPWIRGNPQCPIGLEEVPKLEHILVTHDHGDHLGDAIDLAKRDDAKIIAIYDLAEYVRGQGVKNAVGANIGGWMDVDGIKYKLTPALHSCKHGVPVGFLIRLRDGKVIYHAGDTGFTNEFEVIGRLNRIDVAMLPIGGHFTMDIREAVIATQVLNPRVVVPMHYGTFPQIKANPEEFKKALRWIKPEVEVRVLKPGESFTI